MSEIPEFTSEEIAAVRDAIKERFGHDLETHLADVEVRIYADDRELTECPAIYWEHDECHFVICKTGEERYRSQFYYRGYDQYGTGIEEYTDIVECALTLLRVQADHELERKGAFDDK
ncbi:MAG: hypothetical protein JSW10_09325 [Pseudomonadota bacterium]|nr:MAG: hypothetical protein JSW10_09325 [Pseudomonadota bacterium]